MEQRLARLEIEVRETRAALAAAQHFDGPPINYCACGRITLAHVCQVCEAAAASAKDAHEH